MTSSITLPQTLYSIQALRGIAALLVVLYHCAQTQLAVLPTGQAGELDGIFRIWGQGYAGVDVFFVISGFVMVYVTRDFADQAKHVGKFLFDRFTRIYPLWWLYALAMVILFLIAVEAPYNTNGPRPDSVGTYLLKSFALIPQPVLPVLGVGWSLIHEVYFYLIFAVFLCFHRKYLPVFLAVWALSVFALIPFVHQSNNAINLATLIGSPFNIAFILGAVTALAIIKTKPVAPRMMALIGIIAFVIALNVEEQAFQGWFTWKRVAIYALPSALALYGLVALECGNRLKVPTFLSRLGDWSYSLYLCHIPVLLVLRELATRTSPYLPDPLSFGQPGLTDNIIFTLLSLFIVLITAAPSYHMIERPLLRWTRRLWPA